MAKKRADKVKSAPKAQAFDKPSAWALFFSLLSILVLGVFMFCGQRELERRPTYDQVLEGFKVVDKALEELRQGKADNK